MTAFWTNGDSVGELVLAALLHPKASTNKALKVNSFTTTGHQIVAEFEKQTGGKWEVSYTSADKFEQMESDAWQKSDPRAAVMTLRRIWCIEGGSFYEKTDNDLIEAPAMDTLQHQVELVIRAQTQ